MTVLLILSVIIELVLVLFYMYSPLVRKANRSLMAKTACAIAYVIIGICAAAASGGYSTPYAVLISIGAAFGAFGDYILDLNPRSIKFILGLGSFLIGHIFYTAAFAAQLLGNAAIKPPQILITVLSAIIVALILVAAGRKLEVEPGKGLVPVLMYVVAISTMLTFAAAASIEAVKAGKTAALPAAIAMSLGAALFTASDAVLAVNAFSKKKIKIHRAANPFTYFPAQTLLALSIYFVQSLKT
ncbi:MAG: lysoplasmalogenase [Clostridiales bacterium]|nr:lysoplasmalogenase [Clostridiales bacterium]